MAYIGVQRGEGATGLFETDRQIFWLIVVMYACNQKVYPRVPWIIGRLHAKNQVISF